MLVVVALGGNALLRRGEPLDADVQCAHVAVAARAVAAIATEHHLVLTHGNGPQVGLLALQNAAYTEVPSYPLDVLDAETEGMVGYLLEQELGRHLPPDRLATLLTQVVVDPDDPAFDNPTKPVGPLYDRMEAERLAHRLGWSIARDGEAWRRVVPSPRPRSIVELPTIRILVDHGVTVTSAGGGGIPVVPTPAGHLCGVEAVIDKDLAAARLAMELDADALLLLTDVDAVYTGWGTPAARPVHDTTVDELRALPVPAGSMGPKVEAICSFVEGGGWLGAIGSLSDAAPILRGVAGTRVWGRDTRDDDRSAASPRVDQPASPRVAEAGATGTG
jgi:carbamate kinase